ncbi:uncharacterized protein LAJ45_05135 [Morchella importuna]|uniref:uncharacterized protein n=1 Tax=Morchella importuna TaxID=1174673 RepID=UPI001E8EE1EF|nr:uncharacterized protein LAJ45_05135 [Morchella importuna]KAH8150952.1 hypothetical protein LAJ45_05135 [Morchella importuna]
MCSRACTPSHGAASDGPDRDTYLWAVRRYHGPQYNPAPSVEAWAVPARILGGYSCGSPPDVPVAGDGRGCRRTWAGIFGSSGRRWRRGRSRMSGWALQLVDPVWHNPLNLSLGRLGDCHRV